MRRKSDKHAPVEIKSLADNGFEALLPAFRNRNIPVRSRQFEMLKTL